MGSTYDYGHYGVLMKNNIRSLWFQAMVQERDDIVALDSAIILNPRVWESVGSRRRFHRPARRLPHLQAALPRRPDRPGELRPQAVQASGRDARSRPHRGRASSTSCSRRRSVRSRTKARPRTAAPRDGARHLRQLQERPPNSPASSRRSASRRPASRSRNEITPKNFLFRVRELEQMEIEYFVPPADAESAGIATGSTSASTGI